MKINRGEYKIIRVDGTEETIQGKPYLSIIYGQIRCTCVDTVNIDRKNQTVMLVDDTGIIDGKPVNRKATALYHAICKPGTLFSIHGDVAIVNDQDFA